MRVGVLALQGGFEPHALGLRRAGHSPVEVREGRDLRGLEGLVLPGGESTTQRRLLQRDASFFAALAACAQERPTFATCAGVILAAESGWLDVEVTRNAYGPQVHSGVRRSDEGRDVLLIRAPRIERWGENVEVLRRLAGQPILVRQGRFLGATYHPELMDDEEAYELAFGRRPNRVSSRRNEARR